MPKPTGTTTLHRFHSAAATYGVRSRKPLHILVFLLPLVLLYEAGLASVLRDGPDVLTNLAHLSLLQFFSAFGVGGLYLGGVLVLVVLLTWHVLNRDPWTIHPSTIGIMAVESLLLTVPLLVTASLVSRAGSPAAALAAGAVEPAALGTGTKIIVSIGAGIYEELIFRMLVIAVLHTLLVDMGKASPQVGAAVAVAVSTALFVAAHLHTAPPDAATGPILAFSAIAGLYFAAVYLTRGFGIVVGAHVAYDALTLLLFMGSE
jgi:Type II CAAX prenyl endopeptidase Rce1-like